MNVKKSFMILLVLFFALSMTGCWQVPAPNTVEIQTIYSKPTQVVRPPGIWTITTWGDEYFPVNLKSQTPDDFTVKSSTNDNAGFKWIVGLTYSVPDDDVIILKHVAKFGADEANRQTQVLRQIGNQLQGEINSTANNYDAYKLLASQEAVQKAMFDNLQKFFSEQLFLKLENLQLKGKPDFDNDGIDMAASKVVENQKLKESEQAGLEADKVKQERQRIQAEILSNPALKEIRLLELKIELEKARSEGIKGHSGNLTVVYGANDSTRLNINN